MQKNFRSTEIGKIGRGERIVKSIRNSLNIDFLA